MNGETAEPQSPARKCCSERPSPAAAAPWIKGEVETPVGPIPAAATALTWRDRIGGWRVRWGIGRGRYRIPPRLYAVGCPGADAPVLVTANFKLSFDRLRVELFGLDAWILVLDTRGINVWCAAGKGTFGTDELVGRITAVGLDKIVRHRRLILPQLGASGVAAHDVKRRSGFSVEYGPVEARHLPRFLAGGRRADPGMRRVRFPLRRRLILIPMELVQALKFAPVALVWVLLLCLIGGKPLAEGLGRGLWPFAAALLGGTVLFPVLLPLLPFRSFTVNGWVLGGLIAGGAAALQGLSGWSLAGALLLLPPITAFLALNFTGCSTFTSPSGVRRELALSVPPMILSVLGGMAAVILSVFTS